MKNTAKTRRTSGSGRLRNRFSERRMAERPYYSSKKVNIPVLGVVPSSKGQEGPWKYLLCLKPRKYNFGKEDAGGHTLSCNFTTSGGKHSVFIFL